MASSMTDLLASTSATSSCTSCEFHPTLVRAVAGVLNGARRSSAAPTPQPRAIVEIVHNERRDVRRRVPTVVIAIDAILESEPAPGHVVHPLHPIGGRRRRATLIEKFDKKVRRAGSLHAWGDDGDEPAGHRVPAQVYMDALAR